MNGFDFFCMFTQMLERKILRPWHVSGLSIRFNIVLKIAWNEGKSFQTEDEDFKCFLIQLLF